jgi:Tfp pilus assembly protein FimV
MTCSESDNRRRASRLPVARAASVIIVVSEGGGSFVPMARLFRASALFMFAPVFAFGADLGRLTVLSDFGEPLRAEIEILSVQANEATSLAARIPPPDVFWRANLATW